MDYGTISETQLAALLGIAMRQRNIGTHVMEFGTLSGNTTANLARMMPDHHILTCSLPGGVKPSLDFTADEHTGYALAPVFPNDVSPRITHFACDSAVLELPEVALGLVLVDGGHSTAYVLNDFYKASRMVVTGGVVVFHDYGIDGLGGITAVKLAVDRIMEQNQTWDWVIWENMFVIGKKNE
jgi:hypothetical protein